MFKTRLLTGGIVALGTLTASMLIGPVANASTNQQDWVACTDPYCYAPTDSQLGFKVIKSDSDTVAIGWNAGAYHFQNSDAPDSCKILTFDAASDAHPLDNPFYGHDAGQPKHLYIPSHEMTVDAPGGGYRIDNVEVTPGESSYFQISCANTFTVVENDKTLSLDAAGDWMLHGTRIVTDDVAPGAPTITAAQKFGSHGIRVATELHVPGKAGIDTLEYRVLRDGKTFKSDSIKSNPAMSDHTSTSYEVGDLYNGTYRIAVRAHNSVGWGPLSAASQALTIKGNPEPSTGPSHGVPSSQDITKSAPHITSVKQHGAKTTIAWHSGAVVKTRVVIKLGVKTVLAKTLGAKTRSVSVKVKHGKKYSIRITATLKSGAQITMAASKKL